MPESKFTPAQAEELAAAFAEENVQYLFIGKSGAILPSYSETTEDVDIFLLKGGPFALDLIHAPDGIESFAAAKTRRVMAGKFPVASLEDIIASKRATGRQKDQSDLARLEQFRSEYRRTLS